jgi:holo-[acyl-carrier protein] synthase
MLWRVRVEIGMDIVDVADVESSLARFGARYLERVYTARELDACAGGTSARRLATHFAAKEATRKTLGLDDAGVDWRSIELNDADAGEAEVRLSGAAAECASRAGIVSFAVGTGSTRRHATAVVVATRGREWKSASGV